MDYLGVDIAKKSFDVALLGAQQTVQGHFSNDKAGWGKLLRWLQKRKAADLQVGMEATGRYWEGLAYFLHEQGFAVSVLNPRIIKKYAESKLQRNKTDRADALLIAEFLAKEHPEAWAPPPAAVLELQALVRHLQALKGDRKRQLNRRQSGLRSATVLSTIDLHIAFLDEQIAQLEQQVNDHINQHPDLKRNKELLESIPGVGPTCAATFLAEVPDVQRFTEARQVAAFAGLTPGQRQSGTTLATARLVKWGNAHLRAVFYMPALKAHLWNPIIASLRERLLARGKSKMTVIVAVMRKMIHLCFGVLKTGKPFTPSHAIIPEFT